MTTGLYTIPNSSINIKVLNITKVGTNSTTMEVFYLYKSGMVIDFETVTVPNDALSYWVKLED
jgi:hypothetical protein